MSTTINSGIATYQVIVDGKEVSPETQILSITIMNFPNEIGNAYISILDRDPSVAPFPISNSNLFELGKRIEIKLGYDSVNKTCFIGEIFTKNIKSDRKLGPNLLLICRSTETKVPHSSTASVLTINNGENIENFSLTKQLNSDSSEYGQLMIQGTSAVDSGDTITLTNFGNKFSGDVVTKSVSHYLDHGNWRTTISL